MIDIHHQQKDVIQRFCHYAERNLLKKKEELKRFKDRSGELICSFDNQLNELQRLKKWSQSTAVAVSNIPINIPQLEYAQLTCLQMSDLVAQKQQQASLVQAWESARQANESARQGRAIMMFTVVTVIFVPPSFISSLFGMNNVEFTGEGPMTLKDQFKLMFPISISIIFVTIIIAFNKSFRMSIWSICKALISPVLGVAAAIAYMFNMVLIRSGIYGVWLSYRVEGRFPLAALRREMESESLYMKRLAESDVRRAIRRKEFEKRTGLKFEYAELDGRTAVRFAFGDAAVDKKKKPSGVDFIRKRGLDLVGKDLSPSTAGSSASHIQVSSASQIEVASTQLEHPKRSVLGRTQLDPTTPGRETADDNRTGAFALEMGGVDGTSIIGRRRETSSIQRVDRETA
ncbi:hypothetical protein B0T20DRAFT_414617 [Sordaria brevicollis]|uniref:Uncharacterized protein n=1 Tax=Sordaria brevicollis TaxID=83679 RepID=A0AAE0PBH1_SORBR|nr:hypothetical protein B0T20DRAFT_414617 [Sordaria brevicollis]